jgi:hypothetical protein
MIENSKDVEVMAYSAVNVATQKAGILVLPWDHNTRTTSDPMIGVEKGGKVITDDKKNVYRPYEMIHTHPDVLNPSDDDENAALYWEDRYPTHFRSFIIQGGMMYQYYPFNMQGLNPVQDYIDGRRSLLPK